MIIIGKPPLSCVGTADVELRQSILHQIIKKNFLKHGTGGLTMATKRVRDRCGAEINPPNSVTYAGMRRVKNDINDNDYELCVSCAHELRKWFSAPRKDAEGAMIVHL